MFSAESLDLVGIFVFGLSGAVVAMRKHMDVVGYIALAIATGLAGGIVRDVMLGDTPVWALRNPLALLVPVAAALLVAIVPHVVLQLNQPVLFFDAIGLGLFAAVGASKAAAAGLNLAAVVVVGTVSAVGGGLVRDVLASAVPQIFVSNSRLYAVPAALGALLTAVAARTDLPEEPALVVSILFTAALRLLALRFGWHAPVPVRITRRAGDGQSAGAGSSQSS